MWEEITKPGASGIPMIIEWGAVAIGIVGATFYGRLQFAKGKSAPPIVAHAELAGAVIDKEKADELLKGFSNLVEEMSTLITMVKSLSRSNSLLANRIEKNAEALSKVSSSIDELRSDIRDLSRELIRSNHGQ